MKLQFKPWAVPTYCVQIVPLGQGSPTWSLKDVDADVLAEMCDAFREEVFKKAGKDDPALHSVQRRPLKASPPILG